MNINHDQSNSHLRVFELFSQVVSVFTIIVGVFVLIGWWLEIEMLKSVIAGQATMKANAALSFIFLGLALWLQPNSSNINHHIKRVARILALAAALIAALTLIEYILGVDLHFDQVLFSDPTSATSLSPPGRMAHATALNILLFSLAVWLLDANSPRQIFIKQLLTLTGLLIGLIALVGYIYGVKELYGALYYASVSLPSAILFVLFGLGVLCARPAAGVMSVVTDTHYGGVMMRRMLPLVLTLPFIIGWFRLKGQQAGWYGTEFGLACFATSNVLVFAFATWWSARNLNVIDRQRNLMAQDAAHLAAIVTSSEDAIVGKNLQGIITSWNVGAEKIFGYPASEMIGQSMEKLIPSERYNEEMSILSQVRQGVSVLPFDTVRICKDGKIIDVSINVSATKDMLGNIIGTSKVARDISARKLTERALRESEAQFHTMVNAMPQLAWMAEPDGRLFWYNDRWFEYTGTDSAQMTGWGWQSVHDPEMLPLIVENWERAIATQEPFEMEFPLRGADGSYRWFLTRAVPFKDTEGRLLRWFGTNTDVSDKREAAKIINELNIKLEQRVIERTAQLEKVNVELSESQAELSSLFESLPGLYLVLTCELNIVSVSDAYLKATMTKRENIIGRNLFEVFPDNPEDQNATGVSNLKASIDRVIMNGEPDTMAIQKYDIRRPDGVFEEHYWSPINSPVFSTGHQIKYIVHRVEDVTEFVLQKSQLSKGSVDLSAQLQQMEAEIFQSSQKLKTSNQQLEAANKELEAFSYSVSHDLRAPLRHIDGFIEILQKRNENILDSKSQEYIKIISNAAKQMSQLIDDLLSFSRMTRTELMYQKIDINMLIQEFIRNLDPVTRQRNIIWKINPLPHVNADNAMMRQVIANLLSNAAKYTRLCDAAEIEVGAEVLENEVVFHVRDNGVGFDMQYAEKLFGVFQRLHLAEDFEGTGIGLANVRRIIARHGGRVWAEGTQGKGATFYFSLPYQLENKNE